MPLIKITEIDNTGVNITGDTPAVVYMPVDLDGGSVSDQKTLDPVLLTSIADLTNLEASTTAGYTALKNSDQRPLVYHLIMLGYHVLVQGVGRNFFKAKGTEAPLNNDSYEIWIPKLNDKIAYNIRFLTGGGIVVKDVNSGDTPVYDYSYEVINSALIECAKNRGDSIALISLNEMETTYTPNPDPESQDPGTWENSFNYNAKTVHDKFADYIVTTTTTTINETEVTSTAYTDGSYAMGLTPWFKSNYKVKDDDLTDTNIPPEYGYLFAYANSIKTNPEWYAVAGFTRGVIPELSELFHTYSGSDINELGARTELHEPGDPDEDNNDNKGVAVNVIANIRPQGYMIYGNRTLRYNNGTTDLKATSFLNVRNCVTSIKKRMFEASQRYMFDQNSDLLWINFTGYIESLLNTMKNTNGLLSYKFKRLPTKVKGRLKARLNITPIEAVEDFDLEVYMGDDNLELVETAG